MTILSLTEAAIEEMKALAVKATPGPWLSCGLRPYTREGSTITVHADQTYEKFVVKHEWRDDQDRKVTRFLAELLKTTNYEDEAAHNAAFIAAVREFVPAIIAAHAAEKQRADEAEAALLLSASHCQGGHSAVGEAIAKVFGIPHPVRMEGLEQAAKARGYDPKNLWPWLYEMRDARAQLLAETGGES